MWHLKQIPKILHVYWGGGPLSPLRFKTISSFSALNPDWEIMFHVADTPGTAPGWNTGENKEQYAGPDCLQLINNWPKLTIKKHILWPDVSEVHRSDLLRWKLLSIEGGVWSDMDIIYTKPMDLASFNTEENSEMRVGLCEWGKVYRHRIGFLLSSPINDFFIKVATKAKEVYTPDDYQCVGAAILNNFEIKYNKKVINISKDSVYPLTAEQIFDTSSYFINLPDESIGLHWFAGHPLAMKYQNNKPFNTILDKL